MDLGKYSVNRKDGKNCKAFIGYSKKAQFIFHENYSATPNKDIYANIFKKFFNSVVINILNGFSIKESVERTKRLVDQLEKEFEKKYPEVAFIAKYKLREKKEALEAIGDLEASF